MIKLNLSREQKVLFGLGVFVVILPLFIQPFGTTTQFSYACALIGIFIFITADLQDHE